MENNNNEQIKLCPACGAKNKAIYRYCNECGEPLTDNVNAENTTSQSSYTSAPNFNSNPNYGGGQNNYYGTNNGGYSANPNGQTYTPPYQAPNNPYQDRITAEVEATPDFDGVSATDVYDFTGRKIDLFRKLREQHFGNGSGPYCWPLFVLGLTLGFFGMGCWYLYHKLYRPAIGFFAAAVAKLGITIAICWAMFGELLNIMPDYIGDIVGNNTDAAVTSITSALLEKILPVTMIFSVFSFLVGIASLALTIILPFSAYKLYKNNALKKINEAKMNSFSGSLTTVGGSRGGTVAIVSVIWGIVNIALISALSIWLFSGIFVMTNDYLEENGYPDLYTYQDNFDDYNQLPFDDDFDPFADFDY